MCRLILTVLTICLQHLFFTVKNSLTIFAIISTGIRDLPDLFTIVIDNIQVDYYDGNGIRKQSSILWKNISDSYQSPIFSKKTLNSLDVGFTEYLIRLGTLNPDEGTVQIIHIINVKYFFLTNYYNFLLSVLVVHVLQCMIGCEMDEKSAEVVTFQQCGYNGEDFMKLYSKNKTWTAQHPLAEKLKPLWDSAQGGLNSITLFLTLICPQMLETFVTLSALQREGMTFIV